MILDEIVQDKKKRIIQHKVGTGLEQMKEMALASNRKSISFYEALAKKGLSIIGEFKKASPSMGQIHSKIELTDRIDQYNQSVDAISCLTEEDHFQGSVAYLQQIRKISNLPILRKDFIIDEYQIYEAKVIEADGILLIAAILNDEEMQRFYNLAKELGLDVLLEVHDQEELLRALNMKADIIGVNNRNLKDFSITLETTRELARIIEEQGLEKRPLFISESGIGSTGDIEFLQECKVDGILVGRTLMEAKIPKEIAKEWKAVFHEV